MDSDNKGTGSEQQSGLHSHAHPGAPAGVHGCHCNAWTVSYCTLMDYATVSYWYICMSLTTSPQGPSSSPGGSPCGSPDDDGNEDEFHDDPMD